MLNASSIVYPTTKLPYVVRTPLETSKKHVLIEFRVGPFNPSLHLIYSQPTYLTILLDCKATSSPKEEFPKQSLEAHNKFRSMHGVPLLSWADDLAKEAQAWAEKLANARTLQHASKSERNDAGENIAMFTGSFDTAGEKATDMWYVICRLLH